MKEIFALIQLITKILDFIPDASEKAKKDLFELREKYLDELARPKHNRDDALIDELREKILRISSYATMLVESKTHNISIHDYFDY